MADTVDEFCARVGLSRRHFYALLRRGEGPPTVTVGRRRLIAAPRAKPGYAGRRQE